MCVCVYSNTHTYTYTHTYIYTYTHIFQIPTALLLFRFSICGIPSCDPIHPLNSIMDALVNNVNGDVNGALENAEKLIIDTDPGIG